MSSTDNTDKMEDICIVTGQFACQSNSSESHEMQKCCYGYYVNRRNFMTHKEQKFSGFTQRTCLRLATMLNAATIQYSLTRYQEKRRSRDFQPEMSVSFSSVSKPKLVLCRNAETLTGHISKLILDPNERISESRTECARRERRSEFRSVRLRRNSEVCGRLMLPANFNTQLSEEEVCKFLCCVSLCDPGVHAILFIILDDTLTYKLTDGDKAKMEAIQRILSSRINKHIVVLISHNSENRKAELHNATNWSLESFQRQHNSRRHTEKVSTLVGRFEQMAGESRAGYFCTDIFLEVQVEEFLESRFEKIQSQGLRENADDESFVVLGQMGVGTIGTGNTTFGNHLKLTKQMSKGDREIRQVKCHDEYKEEKKLIWPKTKSSLKRGDGDLRSLNGGLTETSDLIKNILICVLKMNKGLTDVERHEGE
ncbi:uncharacterized protein LOC127506743 isoform X4 [Ctenopharyngodon idella]|uniref:uncharacterized protein LOC127506743 isoform X4 n=1 Tax=Ctenopharyngodon idella TaxID=7959 RepID=UPI002231E2B5|nr:uncharacterized protein LOC127506743 isoform X4 [Ctenopharyngodon idella]